MSKSLSTPPSFGACGHFVSEEMSTSATVAKYLEFLAATIVAPALSPNMSSFSLTSSTVCRRESPLRKLHFWRLWLYFATQVTSFTDGERVDVVVEAVGKTGTVATAIGLVRKESTVILIGNSSPQVALPLQKVVTRQIRLQGSCASVGEYPRSIELMASGAIDVKLLNTAVATLEDGPDWSKRLHAREPGLTRVVLTPSGTT